MNPHIAENAPAKCRTFASSNKSPEFSTPNSEVSEVKVEVKTEVKMEVKMVPRLLPQLTLRLSAKACKNHALVLKHQRSDLLPASSAGLTPFLIPYYNSRNLN